MTKRQYLLIPPLLFLAVAGGWGSVHLFRSVMASTGPAVTLPTTKVKRGDVTFTIAAKGDLAGGNSEMLTAPMTGGRSMAITFLRESGELVNAGDVVVKFDTAEQEFLLREAQADLAEADQQVIQAENESQAKEEEARYALMQARSEEAVAKLEIRRNELVAAMVAKQNDLALEAAQAKVAQLEKDLGDRIATAKAGIAIQEAGKVKAKVAAETAQKNIDSMTLRAKSNGYVARQQNTEGNFMWGSYQPALQVGDNVEAGVGVAQIPDMKNWEATAQIGELDRGYIAVGQPALVRVIALPGQAFEAEIKNIGGTTGPPWNRRFECKLGLKKPVPELRPGMSVDIIITTETLKNVLWLPAQALFENDGKKFVYAQSAGTFSPRDVKLIRRSESQVVLEGVPEGALVSLASPEQMKASVPGASAGGALKAISK